MLPAMSLVPKMAPVVPVSESKVALFNLVTMNGITDLDANSKLSDDH